jgi:hypothetical protein
MPDVSPNFSVSLIFSRYLECETTGSYRGAGGAAGTSKRVDIENGWASMIFSDLTEPGMDEDAEQRLCSWTISRGVLAWVREG